MYHYNTLTVNKPQKDNNEKCRDKNYWRYTFLKSLAWFTNI